MRGHSHLGDRRLRHAALVYVACFIYPGVSLALVRSFAEHRAEQEVGKRTAIVENARFSGRFSCSTTCMRRITCAAGCPVSNPEILPPQSRRPDRAQRRPCLQQLFRRGATLSPDIPRPPDSPRLGRARGVSGAADRGPADVRFPWTAAANDALWASISAGSPRPAFKRRRRSPAAAISPRNGAIPAHLRPGLRLPLCGRPENAVALIAAPEYAFPGCEGAAHRSFIICRAGDPRRELAEYRGSTAALNAHDSNTGMKSVSRGDRADRGQGPSSAHRRHRLARGERDRGHRG